MGNRTIICRMETSIEEAKMLASTCDHFAFACNIALAFANKAKISNKIKLHHLCYYPIRSITDLTSNLVIRAIRRVSCALKACEKKHKKSKRKFKPDESIKFSPTSIDYDSVVFDYREKDGTVSISTVVKRIHVPIKIGKYQRDALRGKNPTAATVVRKKNKWYIHICIKDEDQPKVDGPAIGIDLGIRNTHATSTNILSGDLTSATKNKFRRTRASLQSKGTKGAKHVLKRLSGKEARVINWINHNESKKIVKIARNGGFGTIRFEKLSNIRKRKKIWNKHLNRMIHGWSFGELQTFTSYKAQRLGIAVEFVNPENTSKICHRCGSFGKREQDEFSCITCGWMGHADFNAACNIAAGGVATRGSFPLTVNRPESECVVSNDHRISESPRL